MKDTFNIKDNSGVKITLGSHGLTPAGAFFLILAGISIIVLMYALLKFTSFTMSGMETYSAYIVMGFVLVSSIVLFLVAYSLSYEVQEISIDENQLKIKKIRPIWPSVSETIDLDQVDGFAMEKLSFNFINVWYAFIFHKEFSADEVENFLSPQVRMNGKVISFFEYADDKYKKMALEKIKAALKPAI